MSNLLQIVWAVILGGLLSAAPAPALSFPSEAEPLPSEVQEVTTPSGAATSPARPAASRRVAPVVRPARSRAAAPAADSPHPVRPRIHILHCVWHE